MPEAHAPDEGAPFAYDGLDRVIHEKARLGVLTALSARPDGAAFSELKRLCALTDGNLSRHLQALETAELVSIEKRFAGKRPLTVARLTAKGRSRFLAYLAELERVLKDASAAARSNAADAEASSKSAKEASAPKLPPA